VFSVISLSLTGARDYVQVANAIPHFMYNQ